MVPESFAAFLLIPSSLVCSDLISRGLDISHVAHVVSYDVPIDIRKYIHRVGRTARAGRHGEAWTLVEEQEVGSFGLSFVRQLMCIA
jgi:superfamily II DNA/RNA helicase